MKRACRVLLLVLLGAAPAGATIDYSISLAQPELHRFRVTMRVPDVADALRVQMPAWNALYQIRDFAHRVQQIRARADDRPAALHKLDKLTWEVRPARPAGQAPAAVTIEYAVVWDEPGPFNSQLDPSHAFLNFAMVLLYVPERRGEDVRVEFLDLPAGWSLATSLRPGGSSSSVRAPSYDALADAPVEIGRFEEERFEVSGARVRVVVHGTAWNRAALRDALRRIVEYQTRLMGEVPFEEFLFIYHFGLGGNGGMEHAESTAIALGANAGAAGISAHEFFHLWNVKRLRPRSLEPVDYTRENWTRALWFAEGVTSTYAAFTLVRTGLWSREQFLADLAQQIAALESRPARLWQSAEQASLDAWLERYALHDRPDLSISYYNKGQILGVLLDILIRDATENRRSLDDVFRHLNREFARRQRFYNDTEDVRAAVERVAGRSFADFFARYVAGTAELPCAETLALAGLELVARGQPQADFGFRVAARARDTHVVADVHPGTPAEAAGLRPADVLLTLDGQPFPRDASAFLRQRRPGQRVRLAFRRGAETLETTLELGAGGARAYELRERSRAVPKQRRILEGLLRGTTDPE